MAVWPGDETTPVLTTIYRDSGTLLARIGRGPLELDVRFIAPQAGGVRSAALLSEERVVTARGDLGLWRSDDLGDSWQRDTGFSDDTVSIVLASPSIHLDDIALVGTTEHLWRTTDAGDTWEVVLDVEDEVRALAWSPAWESDGTVCALVGETRVTCSQDQGATWSARPTPPQVLTGIAVTGSGQVWGAGTDGLLHTTAGDEWQPSGLVGDEVQGIYILRSGVLLAVRQAEAVWRSEDHGRTWTLLDADMPPSLIGVGAPMDNIYFRQFYEHPLGRLYQATWSGVYYSDDEGLTWDPVETELPWVTRALDVSPGPDGVPWVLLAKYGGGVTRLLADGTRASSVCAPIEPRYFRGAAIGPGAEEGSGSAIFVTDFASIQSTLDGGVTWESQDGAAWYELGQIDVKEEVSAAPLAIAAGDEVVGSTFTYTEDGGQTWQAGVADQDCWGGRRVIDGPHDWEETDRAWSGCRPSGHIYLSEDGGRTWDVVGQSAGEWLFQVKGIPGERAAFVGTDGGYYRFDEDAGLTLLGFEGEQVTSHAISPDWQEDGTAFVVTGGAGWYRTTDFGETWEELVKPTLSPPEMMAVSQAFGHDRTVVVGTYDGAWASLDLGESWHRVTGVDRIEEVHDVWTWTGSWEAVSDPAASGGKTRRASQPGLRASVTLLGNGVDLVGPIEEGGGRIEVSVDGGTPEAVDLFGDPADQVVLWGVRDLDYGLHTVDVEVTTQPATLDAVLGWHESHATTGPGDSADSGLDSGGPDDSGGVDNGRCRGCGNGGAASSSGLLLALAWVLGLRRREGISS